MDVGDPDCAKSVVVNSGLGFCRLVFYRQIAYGQCTHGQLPHGLLHAVSLGQIIVYKCYKLRKFYLPFYEIVRYDLEKHSVSTFEMYCNKGPPFSREIEP